MLFLGGKKTKRKSLEPPSRRRRSFFLKKKSNSKQVYLLVPLLAVPLPPRSQYRTHQTWVASSGKHHLTIHSQAQLHEPESTITTKQPSKSLFTAWLIKAEPLFTHSRQSCYWVSCSYLGDLAWPEVHFGAGLGTFMAGSPKPGKHKCGDTQRFWHSIPSSCICWPILLKTKDIKTFFYLKVRGKWLSHFILYQNGEIIIKNTHHPGTYFKNIWGIKQTSAPAWLVFVGEATQKA